MKICICGGGNLGHVCAGFLANRGHKVSILTTKPQLWGKSLEIIAPDGNFVGQLASVSSDPNEVIPQAEIVLVCLPGFAIHDELEKIKPHLSKIQSLVLLYQVQDSSSKHSKFCHQTLQSSDFSECPSSHEL